jgi:MarR family transcriptional regulator for hemolysin
VPARTSGLGALEAKGYVRRWREPDNRRVQRTALTPAGEELFERLRSRLTEEETALLGELLDKLRAGLQE